MRTLEIRTKRIYETAVAEDGYRMLIDRIWPRGVSKDSAAIDCWAKDIAPSHELRKWYRHDHAKWGEFLSRYTAELDANSEAFQSFVDLIDGDVLTLVYSSKETEFNNAQVLRAYIKKHLAGS